MTQRSLHYEIADRQDKMKCNEVIAAVVFAGRQSQTDSTYKGRLSLREGEGRVRVAPSEIVLPGVSNPSP